MKTKVHLWWYLDEFYLDWNIKKKKNVVEKIKTHILFSITFFPQKNLTTNEVMWKNMVEPDRRCMLDNQG